MQTEESQPQTTEEVTVDESIRQAMVGIPSLAESIPIVPASMDSEDCEGWLQAGDGDACSSPYTGDSVWAALEKESAEPLYEEEDTLYLSASSMKTYMTCPRQFYYRHMLHLPQPQSDAAVSGLLIHRLMEVFNRQAEPGNYTLERLQSLVQAMFHFQEDPDAFGAAGFTEKDREALSQLGPLHLSAFRQKLLDAVTDLDRKGYFERYGALQAVEAEKKLEEFTLEGIDGCRFRGAIDALIQDAEGRWEIIDYKTFRSAYGAKGLDTCDRHFLSTLEALPEDDNLTHTERFKGKLNAAYPKDYQLPLYYLACNADTAYQNNVSAVAMQIIRPVFPENDNQGAIRLAIPGHAIDAQKEQLLSDIQRYIVQPIRDSHGFEAAPTPDHCNRCAYWGLCEAVAEEDGMGAAR